jgi:hypothetical protein
VEGKILPGAFYVAGTLMIGLPNYILFFIVYKVPWLYLQVNPK